MDDLISRQMALDAFGLSEKTRKYGGDHSGYDTRMLYEIQDTLENLPAVQPDHNADISKKVSISCGQENDLISRQAATSIPILPKEHRKIFKSIDDAFETGWNEALSCVNMLPSAQPATNCSEIPNGSDDTISRQAAIDAVGDWIYNPEDLRYHKDVINSIPAVQPEIIRCKDCKYMIDTGDDLMCDNAKGWVVATASDFGCVLAERRTDGQSKSD